MRFVKELRRANSALVDAFEKSKKRQQADKRRLKLELVTYMNRVQGTSGVVEVSSDTKTGLASLCNRVLLSSSTCMSFICFCRSL